jgi:ABC-type transport system involved in cytochrome c biogenesis permease subunit
MLGLALPLSTTMAEEAEKPVSLDLIRDKEVVELFRSLPVLDAGRIKPLDTVMRFRLLRFRGWQSVPLTDKATGKKETLNAMEWMLLSWLRPDLAKDLPLFVVDNTDALIEVGLDPANKRDKYSYNDILPAREKLMVKMREYSKIESKERKPEQRILVIVASNFLDFEMMLGHFDFVRAPFGDQAKSLPPEIAGTTEGGVLRLSKALPKVMEYFKAHPEAAAPMANPWLMSMYRAALGAHMSGNNDTVFRPFPPTQKEQEAWFGPGEIIQKGIEGGEVSADELGRLASYEEIYLARNDAAAFKAKVKAFRDEVVKAAAARGEAKSVPLEISYHKRDYFFNATMFFVCAFFILFASLAATAAVSVREDVSFFTAKSRIGGWLRALTWLPMLAGAGMAVAGIVIRCVIMQRPPITNLYETIIFIATLGVITALIAEMVTKMGLAMLAGCIGGIAGLTMSILFMNNDGVDTMQQLEAVLITNFWLATHVTIINTGYAICMMAAIFSWIYFGLRLIRVVKAGDKVAKMITSIAYALVVVGLLFSLVGTVLGGIWANYSWGRFWGWDPKENGALMIVLMNLIILHARLGGYIREVGTHVSNVFLGMIVIFSWFGVNQLGVGLHAYGATEGMWRWLYMFWGSQFALMIYGMILSKLDKQGKAAPAAGSALPQAG